MKFLTILGLVCLSGTAFSQATIPFSLENNCIYIYCKVNETDSVKFLFDTGADGSVINADSDKAKSIAIDGESINTGSNGSNTVSSSSSNQVSFSGIVKKNVFLTLIPFGTADFDGVFGTNLMNKHIIEIDYGLRVLRFYERTAFQKDLADYEKLKIHYAGTYPTIECTLNIQGKKYSGYFGLDSGANDALTIASPYVQKHKLKDKTKQIALASFRGSDGSVYEMSIVSAPELKVGERSFYEIPMNLSDAKEGIDASTEMAGFFGNNFLKRFNTILDLERGVIYFKPNTLLYTPFFN